MTSDISDVDMWILVCLAAEFDPRSFFATLCSAMSDVHAVKIYWGAEAEKIWSRERIANEIHSLARAVYPGDVVLPTSTLIVRTLFFRNHISLIYFAELVREKHIHILVGHKF